MGNTSGCQPRLTDPWRLFGGGERGERIDPVPVAQSLAIGTPRKLDGGGILGALAYWLVYIRQAWRCSQFAPPAFCTTPTILHRI